MSKRNSVEVKLDLEMDVLTAGFAADLVSAIIECLLYQRNQIPFVFPTFKNLVSKWKSDEEEDLYDYLIEKQRNLARITLNGINDVILAIRQEFKKSTVVAVRLLFGSTIATPREAFTIKLPKISRNHSPENHRQSADPIIRKLLMSLVTSENLYKVFSSYLPTTNMFVDLQVFDSHLSESEHFFKKDFIDIPPKCTSVVIDIHHKTGDISLNCCREIEVFRDVANIRISEEKSKKLHPVTEAEVTWWEANCFVRGYKDVPIKGKFLWQSDKCLSR